MARKRAKLDARVWKRLKKKLAAAERSHVRVGILGSKGGNSPHPGSKATVLEVATIHEFGAPKAGIPERSFIRATFNKNQKALGKKTATLARQLINGRISIGRALSVLGQWGEAEVKNFVTQGPAIPPPNSPATIAAKGSSRTLVNTGRMIGSISYEVHEGGK